MRDAIAAHLFSFFLNAIAAYLGIADAMSIARVLKMTASDSTGLSKAVSLSTGAPTPEQWACRRRCRGRADIESLMLVATNLIEMRSDLYKCELP